MGHPAMGRAPRLRRASRTTTAFTRRPRTRQQRTQSPRSTHTCRPLRLRSQVHPLEPATTTAAVILVRMLLHMRMLMLMLPLPRPRRRPPSRPLAQCWAPCRASSASGAAATLLRLPRRRRHLHLHLTRRIRPLPRLLVSRRRHSHPRRLSLLRRLTLRPMLRLLRCSSTACLVMHTAAMLTSPAQTTVTLRLHWMEALTPRARLIMMLRLRLASTPPLRTRTRTRSITGKSRVTRQIALTSSSSSRRRWRCCS